MAFFNKKKKEQELATEGDSSKIATMVKQLYQRAYDAKSSEHERWDRNMKAYTGELFLKNLPDYKVQEISNYMFSTVETIKPIMLSENPKVLVLPNYQNQYEKSENVQHAIDYEWQREKMFGKLVSAITSGLIYGNLISAITWDANDMNGLGNVKYTNISVWNFFPDPMATCIEDCEYVIYAVYKSVGEIIKAFPDKAEELKNNIVTPSDTYLNYGKDTSYARNQILCLECYLRDWSTEVTEEEQEDGSTKQMTKLKYPNGRHILIAGDVVLVDEQSIYKGNDFPYRMWKCYEIPGKFWAFGEVDQIISPQESIANITNDVIENIGLTSNPVWIVDKNSGIEKNSLTNRKGLVVRKNPGTDVHREPGQSLPAYITNIVEMLKKDIEVISGVHDVTRGERPTGITAGVAIQALNESAQSRIKLKVQNLEDYLASVGSLWHKLISQFWVTPRMIRVTGGKYSASSTSGVFTKPQDEEGIEFTEISKDDVDGDFDIFIVGGSTMPVNKTSRLQQLIQIAQTAGEDGKPMIDRQTMLENADIPNVSEILQRFDAVNQNELMLQQQQTQQQFDMGMQKDMINQQMSLQGEQAKLQSEVGGQDSTEQPVQDDGEQQALMQVIRTLLTMNPEKVMELAKQSPEVEQALQMMQEMSPEQIKMIMSQQPNIGTGEGV
jgi:hypothetical protein